jgi:hypothetical protein
MKWSENCKPCPSCTPDRLNDVVNDVVNDVDNDVVNDVVKVLERKQILFEWFQVTMVTTYSNYGAII